LRVPHIGWNDVERQTTSRLLADASATFYFVHAFHLHPRDPAVVTGRCDYGGAVTAIVEQRNIVGTQFHPEKSQRAGLSLLRAFMEM
jgi:imidazole glycerol-phosphate synthase subunit HisH